jgi:GntR family transcriptional regulator
MAQFRLELGPIPLHHQVYLDLRRALDLGEFKVGERLPTERELASRYGCSLITIRHALGELTREERIERTRGRGTFVLPRRIEHDFAGEASFEEEMRRRGLEATTSMVARHSEPAGEAVARELEIEPGSTVFLVERLRLADGEPLLLEQARLPTSRFPGLLEVDLERNSLYELLAQRYGMQVARTTETIAPVQLPAREARLLAARPRTLALLILGTASTRNGVPVEYTRSYIRTDRTRYRLERNVLRRGWARALEPAMPAVTEGRVAHR